ncbi:TerB N-terminal domain-containing protein [Ruminococcus flavefaciens]|uniref:TerB-C domain-containing protein n=1 Tax=Ruminococcus flavefaciens TaxID=1265 RepID=A0A1M7HCX6_RUMFL|nr:TerB N-terminal domain-containing protein [Ruminococcus flavefaciens]SHM26298.1 TerB-C domain-containing protein [Ruminococcus flavefaciens]
MSDTKEILNIVLNDEKLLNSRAFRERIYSDEPIIRPASQLIKPQVPPQIKEMKGIAFTPEAYWKTSAWLFYTQGKFMENYEDDFQYNKDFVKYYPCYRDLTTEQLRGYFSWRTEVRKGRIQKAPLPYVFIYLYELINCIGANSPAECFDMLKHFCSEYRKIDDTIEKYTDSWLTDFIIYYDLNRSLADDIDDIKHDKAIITLIHWEKYSKSEIFDAIEALSAYRLKKSLYYISESENFREVLVRCFIILSEFFRNKRKKSLCEKLFGCTVECGHHMFSSAIFYDKNSLRNCEYTLNEVHSYSCRNGKWFCKKYYGNRGRNTHLGYIVKAVDSLLREYTDFKYKMGFDGISKNTEKILKNEIEHYFEEKRHNESMKIEIDISKLNSIRTSADKIREKLIIEEEPDIEVKKPTIDITMTEKNSDMLLGKDEYMFICSLLYGVDHKKAAADSGKMVSILADTINEKLFDNFGDTVIEFSGDEPIVIDDYTEELKKMFPMS